MYPRCINFEHGRVIKTVLIILYTYLFDFFSSVWNADGPPKMSVLYLPAVYRRPDGKVKIITLVLGEKNDYYYYYYYDRLGMGLPEN